MYHPGSGDASQRAYAQVPVLLNVGDYQPKAVHMGGEHNARATALFMADQVAHHISKHLIGIGSGKIGNDRSNPSLVPGGAKGAIERLNDRKQFHITFLLSSWQRYRQ